MRLKATRNFTPPRLVGCYRPKSGDRLTGGVLGRARYARSHRGRSGRGASRPAACGASHTFRRQACNTTRAGRCPRAPTGRVPRRLAVLSRPFLLSKSTPKVNRTSLFRRCDGAGSDAAELPIQLYDTSSYYPAGLVMDDRWAASG